MSADLYAFLTTNDLDDLSLARSTLAVLTPGEIADILIILDDWKPAQAIANLLLFPDLIPASVRFQTILKGLSTDTLAYHRLATTVGLQRLENAPFSDSQNAQILERLLAQIKRGDLLLANRATVVVGQYLRKPDAPKIIDLLDHPDAAITHNLLTVLIELVGLKNVPGLINSALESEQVRPAAKSFLKESLSRLEDFFRDGRVDTLEFLASPLSTPLLAYIPNFSDHQNQWP